MPMPIDPKQRQSAMTGMFKAPVSSAPQGIFSPAPEEASQDRVDTEEGLMEEMKNLERMKMDGSMEEPDYLRGLHDLQVRWEKVAPTKNYMSNEQSDTGPFGR